MVSCVHVDACGCCGSCVHEQGRGVEASWMGVALRVRHPRACLSSLENAAVVIWHARAHRGCMLRLESVHEASGHRVYRKCQVEEGHGGVTNAG
jgi:hypothetical protein